MFNLINGLKKIVSLLFNRDRLSEHIEIRIDINYNIYWCMFMFGIYN